MTIFTGRSGIMTALSSLYMKEIGSHSLVYRSSPETEDSIKNRRKPIRTGRGRGSAADQFETDMKNKYGVQQKKITVTGSVKEKMQERAQNSTWLGSEKQEDMSAIQINSISTSEQDSCTTMPIHLEHRMRFKELASKRRKRSGWDEEKK